MISAMARAYQVCGEEHYLKAAVVAADFILENMVRDGQLLHTYKDGQSRIAAFQDDYACLINGLLDLYEASFELRFFLAAEHWAEVMIERFWDAEDGGFFYAEAEAKDLIVRGKNPFDIEWIKFFNEAEGRDQIIFLYKDEKTGEIIKHRILR